MVYQIHRGPDMLISIHKKHWKSNKQKVLAGTQREHLVTYVYFSPKLKEKKMQSKCLFRVVDDDIESPFKTRHNGFFWVKLELFLYRSPNTTQRCHTLVQVVECQWVMSSMLNSAHLRFRMWSQANNLLNKQPQLPSRIMDRFCYHVQTSEGRRGAAKRFAKYLDLRFTPTSRIHQSYQF